MVRRNLLFLLVACIAVPTLQAKCPRVFIVVEGEVKGVTLSADHKLEISVQPEPGATLPAVTLEEDRFSVRIPFDSFKSYGFFRGHNCSRAPKSIRVVLKEADRVILKRELLVPRDFSQDTEGNYQLREKLVLELDTKD